MGNLKLRGKDLEKIGFPKRGNAISIALNTVRKHYKKEGKQTVLWMLQKLVEEPDSYKDDPVLGAIVQVLTEEEDEDEKQEITLRSIDETPQYQIYGKKHIDSSAKLQLRNAMRLPISKAGALMPDAHHGYGLPIGGVLATQNVVIPYGVGMDIGCRMCLTVYDLPAEHIHREKYLLTEALKEHTRFGDKAFSHIIEEDPIFDRIEFREHPFVRKMKDKAYRQLGSSGSGNHFVEFGIVEMVDYDDKLKNLELKKYLGILSHSGSRGFGANIAQHYTKIAREKCLLPREVQHLAWLDLDSEAGIEYWIAMNLAGDYASACHNQIHKRLARAIGAEPIATVENHHNFAWKERLADGSEVIVHRKGATPAHKGELGVIPGSMTAPGFIVRGKGNVNSINSAAHGAGRAMSRTKAKNSFTNTEMKKVLKQNGVKLIGGAIDESPMSYKDIHQVMGAQRDLVDVLGTFTPKIVRMARSKR